MMIDRGYVRVMKDGVQTGRRRIRNVDLLLFCGPRRLELVDVVLKCLCSKAIQHTEWLERLVRFNPCTGVAMGLDQTCEIHSVFVLISVSCLGPERHNCK